MADVVLVVDMLRGFMEEGHSLYCGAEARKIIAPIEALLRSESKKGSTIFFVADNHAPNDSEFEMFPPHCVEGTPEAEVIPELKSFADNEVHKNRYSAFFGTGLDRQLQKLKPGKITVCGVCTDICVMHTVADARNRDYTVEVPVDCVASFDNAAHRWALTHMDKVLGAKLIHVKETK